MNPHTCSSKSLKGLDTEQPTGHLHSWSLLVNAKHMQARYETLSCDMLMQLHKMSGNQHGQNSPGIVR